jgi:hypothetical protein
LFSVVSGACRMPYRHGEAMWRAEEVRPSCGFYPCYQQMNDDDVVAPYLKRIQEGTLSGGDLLFDWCPDGSSFACMKEQITVAMVMGAIERLMETG